MNTHVIRSDIVSSNTRKLPRFYLLRVIAADAIFITLIAGAAVWMLPAADMKTVGVAHSALWGIDVSPDAEYFPAQYQNQATEIPEHIQAF